MLVFLDVDGVLNSTAWVGERPLRTFIPPATAEEALEEERIDPQAVLLLRRLVEQTGARLVFSSSWRNRMSCVEFVRVLEALGFPDAPVIGATDQAPGLRGDQIAAWLAQHGIEEPFVCIDDGDDFLPGQPLVQTNPDVGITADDVERCILALTASASGPAGGAKGV